MRLLADMLFSNPVGSSGDALARRAPKPFPWPARLHDGSVPTTTPAVIADSEGAMFSLHDCRAASADTGDSEPRSWFAEIIDRLKIKDAGQVLFHYTERRFNPRTLYRYAAGDTPVAGYFIRAVLRSAIGGMFLTEMMRDSDAPWWLEFQEQRAKAALLDQLLTDAKERGIGAAGVRKSDFGVGIGR